MKPASMIAALIGGVVGALIWAAIVHFTGYEVGYVAWAIGGLVGFCSYYFGSHGSTAGSICAVLAILSILGGKFFGSQLAVDQGIEEGIVELYGDRTREAENFAKLESKDEYARFMVDHHFTEVGSAEEVSQEELVRFEEDYAPYLRQFHAEKPDLETWLKSEEVLQIRADAAEEISLVDLVVSNLSPIDLIFALLGIVTAFKVGSSRRDHETTTDEGVEGEQEEEDS